MEVYQILFDENVNMFYCTFHWKSWKYYVQIKVFHCKSKTEIAIIDNFFEVKLLPNIDIIIQN